MDFFVVAELLLILVKLFLVSWIGRISDPSLGADTDPAAWRLRKEIHFFLLFYPLIPLRTISSFLVNWLFIIKNLSYSHKTMFIIKVTKLFHLLM